MMEALLDLLFPPRCAFCGKLLPQRGAGLCAACQRELPWLLEAQARQKGEFFVCCVSPLRYQNQVRESIHRYKFQNRRSYAETYGILVAQCIQAQLAGEYDCISWVPLSAKRLRERGYDQAMLLAQSVAKHLGCTAEPTLRKARHTPAQSGLEQQAQRRANVLGAYEVMAPVAGRRILLIDDVVTTGATLSECGRVLLTAGAGAVLGATLARAH